jgi:YD repeat-containing protein
MRRWAMKIFTLIFCTLLASHLYAADSVDNDYSFNEFCASGGPAFGGKPVNLRSGDETLNRTDLTVGRLYPITIVRMYNSRAGYDSPLGYGWAINHDRRMYIRPDGSITLRKECGWKRQFTWNYNVELLVYPVQYVSPVGDTGLLFLNADGTYTYLEKDGSKENYDVNGRLSSLVDANGNSLVYTYIDNTRDFLWGLLPSDVNQSASLIDAYDYHLGQIQEQDATGSLTGVSVTFVYDTSTGRLTNIQDNTGRTVTYTHDSIGNLTNVTGLAGNSTYGYTDANFKHRMTSVDEDQGTYTNSYDPTTGKVTQQTDDSHHDHREQLWHRPEHTDPNGCVRWQWPACGSD